jgi:hypothetical protein
MNEIGHIFDGDTTTLIRTLEANPLKLILTFPQPIKINSVTLWIGGTPTRISITALLADEKLVSVVREASQSNVVRQIALPFAQALTADQFQIEVLSTDTGEIAHVHLWEVILE